MPAHLLLQDSHLAFSLQLRKDFLFFGCPGSHLFRVRRQHRTDILVSITAFAVKLCHKNFSFDNGNSCIGRNLFHNYRMAVAPQDGHSIGGAAKRRFRAATIFEKGLACMRKQTFTFADMITS